MKLKMIQICTITLLFSSALLTTFSNGIYIDNMRHDSDSRYFSTYTPGNNNSTVSIKNIKGGFGLSLDIGNEGDQDVQNIQINVKTDGGFLSIVPKKVYQIPVLASGDPKNIHIAIFGIGFGKFTSYPNITITVSGPEINTFEKKIAIWLLGPFVRIIQIFPDKNDSFIGYTLFSPEYSKSTYLIDNNGSIVHQWNSSYIQGIGVYLLENGNLIRTNLIGATSPFFSGGCTGQVEIMDWNGSLIWQFKYATNYQYCLHHDVQMLPSGNVLMIAWEYKTADEAIAAGRDPNTIESGQLWPDHLIEVKPTGPTSGTIVWEWHVWNHLIQDFDSTKANYGVVGDHPELININYLGLGGYRADWNHINSIDYNESFDQIILSVRNSNEIWVIDHSTTTQEAAGYTGGNSGKGGDLLYRWGNPETYRAGNASDQKFFEQHDATWIKPGCPGEGNILVFNNGVKRPGGDYSTVDEIIPPINENGTYMYSPGSAYGPDKQTWIYSAENPFDFMSAYISGAQRLPNGNTLICSGANGVIFEVTQEKKIVWQYLNIYPNINQNQMASALRYAPDYPGLKL